ncbi:MAG: YihA family ribosome biogenesis GTP-binding protein [Alphaproteobacteria bacterium]|nr:YihA family ribosome biogenesis GTP-binding protein [Alphaproteobacteria bacterium]
MVDQEITQAELEDARKLFAGPCDFMLGVASLGQLPESALPEVAFAGRSNVGKSSLLNALTNRKTLAKTSNTPGRTQQLNYFNLGEKLYIVDMPGYGYAKVSKEQRDEWTRLVFDYLRGRPTLRCVFILIDSRHGLKDSDIMLMEMLDEAAVTYRILLTKTDKSKTAELDALMAKTLAVVKKHAAAYPHIHATSSIKGYGMAELKAIISSYG